MKFIASRKEGRKDTMSCAGSSITSQKELQRTPSGFIYHSLAHCQTISRVSRRPQKGTLKWMVRQWRVIWVPLTAEPCFLPILIRPVWFDQSGKREGFFLKLSRINISILAGIKICIEFWKIITCAHTIFIQIKLLKRSCDLP